MKIASLHSENIKLPMRLPHESQWDFLAKTVLDPETHRNILFSISFDELHMRDFQVATAHALAMFAAIQDLIYFHVTPINLHPFTVIVKETNATKRYKKRFRQLDLNSPKYFKERDKIIQAAYKHLNGIQENIDNRGHAEMQSLEIDIQNSFATKKEVRTKESRLKKKRKYAYEKYHSYEGRRKRRKKFFKTLQAKL